VLAAQPAGYESWYFSRKVVPAASRHGAVFASHGTNFIEHWQCRGTSLLSGQEFLPVQKFDKRVLERSRHKHYGFVLAAGAKAKTVTS
jgi:hypothetical protein